VGLLFSSIKTLCFGIEAKQPKQTFRNKPKKPKKTEKNEKKRKKPKTNRKKSKKKRENPKFSVTITKYAPYQTVSVGLLFVSVQSKHRKSLFQ
jgi:hypothetical protein